MIKISNLCYTIKNKKILSDVTLHTKKGDLMIVFGPNGAGKTSLFKIISSEITSYEGEVLVNNISSKKSSPRERAKSLAFISQNYSFSLPMIVKDVILAGRYPYTSMFKSFSEADNELVNFYSEKFRIKDLLNRDIRTLSGGEAKRVILVSALVQEVDIILYDEPFTFLDPPGVIQLRNTMAELQKLNKTQMVVTHSIEHLFSWANTITAVKEGKIIYTGEKKFSRTIFKETYGIEYLYQNIKEREVLIPYE